MKSNRLLIFLFFLVFCTNVNAQETIDVFEIARKGTTDDVKVALSKNLNAFNIVNPEGYSPLILACYRGNNEVAKLLIETGSDINGSSKMGTPLMASIVKGNTEIARFLIEKRANIHATDANETTALIYATNFKNYEIASLLIKAGADYNKKDNRGNSALDYAILLDDDKLIETLKNKKL